MDHSDGGDLTDLAAAIADGVPIDWDATSTGAGDRRLAALRSLRILADIADLHRRILGPSISGAAETASSAPLPRQIGRYRIVRLIAQGGMGAVYEAVQDQPQRTVALKVIRPGCASPSLLRRFEREAHVLARLEHPGIARIYDAGTAE